MPRRKLSNDERMRRKLQRAIERYEDEMRLAKANRIRGYEALESMPSIAKQLGYDVEEMAVFYRVSKAASKERAIYISKRGARVLLRGYSVDGKAFRRIDPEDARRCHMGRTMAQLSLDLPNDEVLAAYKLALEEL